jgi:hypothetical protein
LKTISLMVSAKLSTRMEVDLKEILTEAFQMDKVFLLKMVSYILVTLLRESGKAMEFSQLKIILIV